MTASRRRATTDRLEYGWLVRDQQHPAEGRRVAIGRHEDKRRLPILPSVDRRIDTVDFAVETNIHEEDVWYQPHCRAVISSRKQVARLGRHVDFLLRYLDLGETGATEAIWRICAPTKMSFATPGSKAGRDN
jgi:hypothetical protein